MQTHEFLGKVQNKAALASFDEALRATRATFETLAERIGADEARHLAAQLPTELAQYLRSPAPDGAPQRFDSDEFLKRVSEREGEDLPESVYHVRVVLEILQQAVSAGEIADVLERLPADYRRLFAGSAGKLRSA